MNGTGTQEDPYLVSTIGEFITAVGAADKYVKLASDINVSEDEMYKNGISSTISVYSAEIDGANHTIKGLNVLNSTAFNTARATLIKDITIKNMINVCTASNPLISCSASGGLYATFQNVVISARSDCAGNSIGLFAQNGNWKNCAITYMPINQRDLSTVTAQQKIFQFTSASECAIRYDANQIISGGYVYLMEKATDSYVFGTVENMSFLNSRKLYLFSSCTGCASYLNFNSTSSAAIEVSGGSSNIVVTDTSAGVTFIAGTYGKLLTSEQAKSEDYLNSIGFLP